MDVESQIAAYAAKLEDPSLTPRVKKRIFSKLAALKRAKTQQVASTAAEIPSETKDVGDSIAPSTLGKKEQKNLLHLLNKDLATFAVKKQADRAKLAVKQAVKRGVVLDTLTYSNLMNVYIRCNEVKRAAAVLEEMKTTGCIPNVVSFTTLLRGYAENGMISDAKKLFSEMEESENLNSRSITTFLRGCIRVGNVADARNAFRLLSSLSSQHSASLSNPDDEGDGDEYGDITQDTAALEYMVKLLCQSARVQEAEETIHAFLQRSDTAGSREMQAVVNAGLYTELARCTVLQGRWDVATKFVKLALELLEVEDKVHLTQSMKRKFDTISDSTGNRDGGDENAEVANKSVRLFRQHRRAELRNILELIEDYISAVPKGDLLQSFLTGLGIDESQVSSIPAGSVVAVALYCTALSKLLYFGFDGHGDHGTRPSVGDIHNAEEVRVQVTKELMLGLRQKFGLSKKTLEMILKGLVPIDQDSMDIEEESSTDNAIRHLAKALEGDALRRVVQSLSAADSSRKVELNLRRLFHPEEDIDELIHAGVSEDIPVKLEIGSGNGDWVVAQAAADRAVPVSADTYQHKARSHHHSSHHSSRTPRLQGQEKAKGHWIALELRCDRVYNILANHMLTLRPLALVSQGRAGSLEDLYYRNNLAILGGDAVQIVQERIPHSSIDQVFINFPQPPERITGSGSGGNRNQGKHLLTRDFFQQLQFCLKVQGTITILTDNLLYAQNLAENFAEMARTSHRWTLVDRLSPEQGESQSDGTWKVQESKSLALTDRAQNTWQRSVTIWRGEPGPLAGHLTPASSYFDRMWTMGQKKRRWFLFLHKEILGSSQGSSTVASTGSPAEDLGEDT